MAAKKVPVVTTYEPPRKKRGPKHMSDAHKAALAAGREEGRAVAAYMSYLKEHRWEVPRGQPPKKPEYYAKLLAAEKDPVKRVKLRAAKRVAEETWRRRESASDTSRGAQIELAFIKCVKGYSGRFGISFSDWVAEGVPPDVLRRGGMTGVRRVKEKKA